MAVKSYIHGDTFRCIMASTKYCIVPGGVIGGPVKIGGWVVGMKSMCAGGQQAEPI